jgi:PAS domain S-box-containing protein
MYRYRDVNIHRLGETESALMEGEDRLNTLVKANRDGLLVVLDSGQILDANPAFLKMTGYRNSDLPNLKAFDLVHSPNPETLQKLMAEEYVGSLEMVLKTKEGSHVTVEARGYRARHLGQQARMISLRDVSQFREIERAKDAFLTTVSHQLRTPITVAQLAIAQLGEGHLGPLNSGQTKIVGILREKLNTMTQIIHQVIEAASSSLRNLKQNREPISLSDLTQSLTAKYTQVQISSGKRLSFHLSPLLPIFYGNSMQIESMLDKLIGNGFRHAKSHIKVRVDALDKAGKIFKPEADNPRHPQEKPSGVQIRITVEDNGPGIRKELMPYLFQRFVTNLKPYQGPNQSGIGLGLYVAKEIVEQHQGSIWAEISESLGGAKFVVTLPVLES